MTQALALHPLVRGDTPLSSISAACAGIFKSWASLASPEVMPNYEQHRVSAERLQFLGEINMLQSWPKNWDGNESAKPKFASIKNTRMWGLKIFDIMTRNSYEWRKPFISADEGGDVVLEWWYKDRNLTLDIAGSKVTFSQTKDADSSPQITTGKLTDNNLSAKLRWIVLGI